MGYSGNSLPAITNRDVTSIHRAIKEGALEGKVPTEGREVVIAPGYTMSIIGEVTSEDGRILSLNKPNNDFPFLVIRDDVSGAIKKLSVADAMREKFGCYITGYRNTRFAPDDYTLAPKDGDRSNFMLSNLKYVKKGHIQLTEPTQEAIAGVLIDNQGSQPEGSMDANPQASHTHHSNGIQVSDS